MWCRPSNFRNRLTSPRRGCRVADAAHQKTTSDSKPNLRGAENSLVTLAWLTSRAPGVKV